MTELRIEPDIAEHLHQGRLAIDSDGTTFTHPNGRVEPMRSEVFTASDGDPGIRVVGCRHLVPIAIPIPCPTCGGVVESYSDHVGPCPDCSDGWYRGEVTLVMECATCEGVGCDIDYCTDCGDEFNEPCERHRDHVHEATDDECCLDCDNGQRKVGSAVIERVLPVVEPDDELNRATKACVTKWRNHLWLCTEGIYEPRPIPHLLPYFLDTQWAVELSGVTT